MHSHHHHPSPKFIFVAVHSLSLVQLFATLWTAAHQASLSFTISQSLLKLMSIESVIPSNHLILRHPLLLLRSVFPSIRVSSSESTLCIRWPKYWSLSFNISPSSYKTTLTPHASPIASGTHPSAFCLHELQLAFPCKRSPSSFSLAHAFENLF